MFCETFRNRADTGPDFLGWCRAGWSCRSTLRYWLLACGGRV